MAIKHGVALAKSLAARVTAIIVFPTYRPMPTEALLVSDTPEQYRKNCDALGAKYLGVVTNTARASDVSCEVVQVVHDSPFRAIIETATEKRCDLICMASHGRKGVAAVLLGSETTKVLTHSRIPVLVYR